MEIQKGTHPIKTEQPKTTEKTCENLNRSNVYGFPASNLKRFCPTIYTLMENITINTNFAPIAFVISVLFFRVRFSLQWITKIVVHFFIWFDTKDRNLLNLNWFENLHCTVINHGPVSHHNKSSHLRGEL